MNVLDFGEFSDASFYQPAVDLVKMAILDSEEKVREIAKTGFQDAFEGEANLLRDFRLIKGFVDRSRIYVQFRSPTGKDVLIDFGAVPERYLGRKPNPIPFDRITYS